MASRLIAGRGAVLAALLIFASLSACLHTRTVSVHIAVDSAFRERPDWEKVIRARIASVSHLYRSAFGIQFKITKTDSWLGPSEILEQQRADLRREVPRAPAEVLLGIRSFPGPSHGRSFGSVVPYSNALVVLDYRGASEQENVRILAHQLAHLFGASHLHGAAGLMDTEASSTQFDPETTKSINEAKDFDFASGLGNLDRTRRDRLLSFYRERLPAGVANPSAKAFAQLGILLAEDDQTNQALKAYDDSLRLDPNDPLAHYHRGHLVLQQNRAAEAITSLREAIQLRPAMADAHEDLALALLQQHNLPAAEAELLSTLQIEPQRASAHFELGFMLSRDPALFEASLSEMREGLRLQPSNVEGRQALEAIHRTRQELDATGELASKMIASNPANPAGYFSLGASLLLQSKCQDAIPPLEKAFSLDPRLGEAQNDLAIAEYCIGHYANAQKHVTASLALGIHPSEDFIAALDANAPPVKQRSPSER